MIIPRVRERVNDNEREHFWRLYVNICVCLSFCLSSPRALFIPDSTCGSAARLSASEEKGEKIEGGEEGVIMGHDGSDI